MTLQRSFGNIKVVSELEDEPLTTCLRLGRSYKFAWCGIAASKVDYGINNLKSQHQHAFDTMFGLQQTPLLFNLRLENVIRQLANPELDFDIDLKGTIPYKSNQKVAYSEDIYIYHEGQALQNIYCSIWNTKRSRSDCK